MKNQYSRTIAQLCIKLFYHGKQPQSTKRTSNLQNPSSYLRRFLFSAIRKQLLVRPSAFPSLALVSKRSLAWWCSGDCQLPSEGSAFWGLWRRENFQSPEVCWWNATNAVVKMKPPAISTSQPTWRSPRMPSTQPVSLRVSQASLCNTRLSKPFCVTFLKAGCLSRILKQKKHRESGWGQIWPGKSRL